MAALVGDLTVTAAASAVAIVGIILNAKRYERTFPTMWLTVCLSIILAGHALSFWSNTKLPAFIGLILLVVLAWRLGSRWKKVRDAEQEQNSSK